MVGPSDSGSADDDAKMDDLQAGPIRLLLIEDMTADAERILHQFKRAAVAFEAVRVDTADGLFAALEEFSPAIVLSDFSLPQFDGMSALRICRERRPQLPFVFVSGTIGEERAVAALRAGAADYVLKENLSRLVPAVQRAIGDARDRAERASQDAQIARLNRVLRMLKGVNEVLMRCRDRGELLAETCRVAVSLGGYAMAIAATRQAGGAAVKAVASRGIDAAMTDSLRQHLEESAARESSVINTVLRTGKAFIRNEHRDEDGTGWFDSLMVHTGLRACVVLPLFVDGEPSAVLLLTAREPGLLGDEELGMLRDLADSLSFGLQSVQRDTRARFLSHFHPQTGLARRALFCDRVRALVAQAATDMPGHAIAIVDIRRL